MSTNTTTDAQKTNTSMVSTPSKDPQQITPQISLRGELPTSVGNPTASSSVAPGESRESLRPTDTHTQAPKNSHENLKKALQADADAAESRWLAKQEARRLKNESRTGGSK